MQDRLGSSYVRGQFEAATLWSALSRCRPNLIITTSVSSWRDRLRDATKSQGSRSFLNLLIDLDYPNMGLMED